MIHPTRKKKVPKQNSKVQIFTVDLKIFPHTNIPSSPKFFFYITLILQKRSLFFQNVQKLRTLLNLNEIRNSKCKTLLHLIRVPYVVSTTCLYAIRLTKYRGETSVSTLQIFYYCFYTRGYLPSWVHAERGLDYSFTGADIVQHSICIRI